MNTTNIIGREDILVLGAGQLGSAVLDSLLPAVRQAGGTVTVMISPASTDAQGNLRSPTHQRHAAAGAKFVAADVAASSVDELATVFTPFATVINCMGFIAGAGTQLKISRAVLNAGVQRYFPWQFGVDYDVVGKGSGQPVWDEQYDVRTLLRQQNATEWVIVSTGMFTSFLFEAAFEVVNLKQRTINALGSWDTQVTVTSPTDIGRLTTAIYLSQPRIVNQVVKVAGETLSYGKLAEIVESASGAAFTRGLYSLPDLQQQLRHHPEDQMTRYRIAFARGTGVWWPMDSTWNVANGIRTQDVADWLRKNHR